MNGQLELRIITQPYSVVYWGYFRRLFTLVTYCIGFHPSPITGEIHSIHGDYIVRYVHNNGTYSI